MSEQKAILAGGCFWGMEDLFRKQPGILKTRVGYIGGDTDAPTYNDIKTGTTNHAESIELIYDPAQTTFRAILEFFFKIHDPTTKDRQGNDRGTQYRSAIFYLDEEQKIEAEKMITLIDELGILPGKIVTQLVPARTFFKAEDYHQDYLEKNPGGYTCHFIRDNWTLPADST